MPNLQVIKLMQSFKSKEYVKEIFSWQYYYYYLTNEGIEYLREYLNLGPDVVPDTLKKSARPAGAASAAVAAAEAGTAKATARRDRRSVEAGKHYHSVLHFR